MDLQLLTSPEELQTYDAWIKSHPQGTLWQSLEWKQYQEALGRETRLYGTVENGKLEATALVIIDRTALGLSTWDVPRGPLGPQRMDNGQWTMDNLLQKIVTDARDDKCLSLYFSPIKKIPVVHCPFSIVNSVRHEQPEATRILDLTKNHEEILSQMHQKGRYNIKVAEKHGVQVERSEDIDAFYALMEKTSARDQFGKHSKKHYEAMLKRLPGSFLLLAYADSSIPRPLPPEEEGGGEQPKTQTFPSSHGGGVRGGGNISAARFSPHPTPAAGRLSLRGRGTIFSISGTEPVPLKKI